MKTSVKVACSVTVGAVLGAGVYFVTKWKQERARKENRHVPYGPYEAMVKRPLDMVVSGVALVVLWPVMAAIGILVKIKLGSPVLFTQERPGKDGKIFKLYKFRSMTDARNGKGDLLSDEERLTGFGKILRSTSLDELPELFNILWGDMAIVGPRPLLVEYLPYYNDRERKRHDVRPGLTGLAQVRGRNTLKWEERFSMDVSYTGHVTFIGDLKIIIDTIWAVAAEQNVVVNGLENFDVYRKRQMESEMEVEYANP